MKTPLALLLGLTLASPVFADSLETLAQRALNDNYPNNPALAQENSLPNCHAYTPAEGDPACLTYVSGQTAFGKTYLLLAGNATSMAHSASGTAVLLIYENDKLLAQQSTAVGSWGEAPDANSWQWLTVGPQTLGVATRSDYTNMGTTTVSHVLLVPQGNAIHEFVIGAAMDNTAYRDCSDPETLQSFEISAEECIAQEITLDSTLSVRDDLPANDGIYPIEIKVFDSGTRNKFAEKSYVLPYDGSKHSYTIPDDYPQDLLWNEEE